MDYGTNGFDVDKSIKEIKEVYPTPYLTDREIEDLLIMYNNNREAVMQSIMEKEEQHMGVVNWPPEAPFPPMPEDPPIEFGYEDEKVTPMEDIPDPEPPNITTSPVQRVLEREEEKEIGSNGESKGGRPPQPIRKGFTQHRTPISVITNWVEVSILEIYNISKYEIQHENIKPEDTNHCSICLSELYDNLLSLDIALINLQAQKMMEGVQDIPVVMMDKCFNHYFHKECLEHLHKSTNPSGNDSWVRCPVCSATYGVRIGTMPPGTMNVTVDQNLRCEGYPQHPTIIVNYNISGGRLPNGTNFSGKLYILYIYIYIGTGRTGYLPDNKEGREILELFKIAFDRKLTFIVGTSVTTGRTNTVVWSGIHHKTAIGGGPTFFGYPDKTYFNRVKQELADKGVTVADINHGDFKPKSNNKFTNIVEGIGGIFGGGMGKARTVKKGGEGKWRHPYKGVTSGGMRANPLLAKKSIIIPDGKGGTIEKKKSL